ncbi:MAG: glycoside hydrolase family 57 protein [Planctomycetota bacterium]
MAATRLAILWHQHQPFYKDLATGVYRMPWVRLHGTKDYWGMARLLGEADVRATVNLVPSLLDQLMDYAEGVAVDSHLELSRKPAEDLTEEERALAVDVFFRANYDQLIRPSLRFRELFAKRRHDRLSAAHAAGEFTTDELRDLQVWGNLSWFHRILLAEDETLAALVAKDRGFTEDEKEAVLRRQAEVLTEIVPMYRDLMERGAVEISTSPYYHPILPLLDDMESARVALPGTPLPAGHRSLAHDASRHLRGALLRHEELFGRRPAGLWPSEGSVSPGMASLVAAEGFAWMATDQEVLSASMGGEFLPGDLYRPHRFGTEAGEVAILFRDHRLSDLVGFDYQGMDGGAAAADFVARVRDIGRRHPGALVTVILDGENPWEYYPEGGVPFLRTLYGLLADADDIETVLPTVELAKRPPEGSLARLHSGSWIHANFAIWAGHEEDVRAWEYLFRTREDLVRERGDDPPVPGRAGADPAWDSLFAAEGSDWTWWYGDDHTSGQDDEFDLLFRTHLGNVYRALGRTPPSFLDAPVMLWRRDEEVREPVAFLDVRLDGRESSYFEWLSAGRYRAAVGETTSSESGAMHRAGDALLAEIRFGFDASTLFLRVDLEGRADEVLGEGTELAIVLHEPRDARIRVAGTGEILVDDARDDRARAAVGEIVEVAVPFDLLGAGPGGRVILHAELAIDGRVAERLPGGETIRFGVPGVDFEATRWRV